jgi:hypothetical protein
MSSQAQIAANRQNGRKSRGPRTAAGKSSASRNARRHGLAAISRHNPAHLPDIERIAHAYCEGDTDPLLFAAALAIAENDVILMCVHTERLAAIARMRDPAAIAFSDPKASLRRARARFARAKLLYAALAEAKARGAAAAATTTSGDGQTGDDVQEETTASADNRAGYGEPANRSHGFPQEPYAAPRCDAFEAMLRAEPDLRRLERYARRAASRRKQAIREFIFIKSLREFSRQGDGGQNDELVGSSGDRPRNGEGDRTAE